MKRYESQVRAEAKYERKRKITRGARLLGLNVLVLGVRRNVCD